ncbi:MAG: MBL fold metallo-hydrolase [Acidimicrobiia bacterium]|nr:MBL fold metallo-hydrolase [Acidimicrobiia bacterium]
MIDITTIETTDLGDRSYLVSDGTAAAVIDPQRDIDRVLAIADARQVRIDLVVETHIHNDYVTGGLHLARETGAQYGVNAADDVAYDRTPLSEGDELAVGSLRLEVIATPGHTPTHLSYALWTDAPVSVDHPSPEHAGPTAVFTGGSLLYGTVGRTDLIGPDATDGLTRAQFRTAQRLGQLSPATEVFPTHGFGSFCSSADSSGAHASTIGQERAGNVAFSVADEEDFVRTILGGLDAFPRYYAHMGPANLRGPAPVDLSPAPTAGSDELRRRIEAGEWVVDLRSRKAYARRHVRGMVGIEGGDNFVTYLGWLVPWGTPVTLVGDTESEVAAAQRSMTRIGIDRPAAIAVGGIDSWSDGDETSYPDADFHELASRVETGPPPTILDVRRHDEWCAGHIEGAIHIPIHELADRIDELATGEVWVHCQSAYRAAIASSVLDRAGKDVVLIDEDYSKASEAGLRIISEVGTSAHQT